MDLIPCSVIPYDLEPPTERIGEEVRFTPLRNLADGPRPRYVPPPLPDGHVRVQLGDDYERGPEWEYWKGADTADPAEIFDVPVEQCKRWAAAEAAYEAMQEEIAALRRTRTETPPGWQPKAPYQVQP